MGVNPVKVRVLSSALSSGIARFRSFFRFLPLSPEFCLFSISSSSRLGFSSIPLAKADRAPRLKTRAVIFYSFAILPILSSVFRTFLRARFQHWENKEKREKFSKKGFSKSQNLLEYF